MSIKLKIEKRILQGLFYFFLIGTPLTLFFTNGSLPTNQEWSAAGIATSSVLWPINNLKDGNLRTSWSSQPAPKADKQEWVNYWLNDFQRVNYIKIHPQILNNKAMGFPSSFNIYSSDGVRWNFIKSFTNMPNPYRDDWIILPFGKTLRANGFLIVATKLRTDQYGKYFFQLSEVAAGYHSFFEHLVYLGNNGTKNEVSIQGMGASKFDPKKMGVWNYDKNNPLIKGKGDTETLNNVYGPSIVNNGGSFWNIYFGGQDGRPPDEGHKDSISVLSTNQNFKYNSFSPHISQLNHGDFTNTNNVSVIKIDSTHWEMVYTAYPTKNGFNKPGYATSRDGAHWNPSQGKETHLLNMFGFANWATADVNGTNSLFYEDGIRYLYWKDQTPLVHLSMSRDGINYYYNTELISESEASQQFSNGCAGINDTKKLGESNYLWVFHCNTNKIWFSLGKTPIQMGPASVLFQTTKEIPKATGQGLQQVWTNPSPGLDNGIGRAKDPYITSVGIVTDGTKLLGVLYGAGDAPSLTSNKIFARWLQHKISFKNSKTQLSWMNSDGPDKTILLMVPNNEIETGSLSIFDTDGKSLRHESPKITIRAGDQWLYRP